MRWALVVVLFVSFAAAADFTFTIATQSREGFEGYLNLGSAMRGIGEYDERLTPEQEATRQRSYHFRSQTWFGMQMWQKGNRLILAFTACAFVWFMALLFFPPGDAAWSRVRWVTAVSIWSALVWGIVAVPVVADMEWVKMEIRWFIGVLIGAVLGALIGILTMGMRKNWEPRSYKTNTAASTEVLAFSLEESGSRIAPNANEE